jgi:hypothetical protein
MIDVLRIHWSETLFCTVSEQKAQLEAIINYPQRGQHRAATGKRVVRRSLRQAPRPPLLDSTLFLPRPQWKCIPTSNRCNATCSYQGIPGSSLTISGAVLHNLLFPANEEGDLTHWASGIAPKLLVTLRPRWPGWLLRMQRRPH